MVELFKRKIHHVSIKKSNFRELVILRPSATETVNLTLLADFRRSTPRRHKQRRLEVFESPKLDIWGLVSIRNLGGLLSHDLRTVILVMRDGNVFWALILVVPQLRVRKYCPARLSVR